MFVRMMHICASGMTTTALSGEEPTRDSTGSDNGKSESTVTDSCIRPIFETMTKEQEEKSLLEFSELWRKRIVEELEPGIFRVSLKSSSSDGSTGPSQEEVEPSD